MCSDLKVSFIIWAKVILEFRDDRERYTWRINRFNLFRDNRFSRKYLLRLISFLLIKIQLKGNIRRSNFIDDDIFGKSMVCF